MHKGVEGGRGRQEIQQDGLREMFLANLRMYQIPGDIQLSEKDVARYVQSNEALDTLVQRTENVTIVPPVDEAEAPDLSHVANALDLEEIYEGGDVPSRLAAVRAIRQIRPENRLQLLGKFLDDDEVLVRREAAANLREAKNITQLIERCLEDSDAEVRRLGSISMAWAGSGIAALIKKGITNDDPLTRIYATDAIPYQQDDERTQLVESILDQENSDQELRLYVAARICTLGVADRIRLIEKYLNDKDIEVRRQAARAITYAPRADHRRLIELVLQSPNNTESIYPAVADSITRLPEDDREQILSAYPAFSREMQKLATHTPLYNGNGDKFFHRDFAKTGSRTVLLDTVPGQPENSLKNRLIIRTIDADAYLSWKHAYENIKLWKDWNFTYVPIEPIVKANKSRDGSDKVEVFTRVINGPSVAMWERNTNLYCRDIHAAVEKIKDALEVMGIDHGHTHTGNFILYFDRDEHGAAILDRPPRVYVIDFDRAISDAK